MRGLGLGANASGFLGLGRVFQGSYMVLGGYKRTMENETETTI